MTEPGSHSIRRDWSTPILLTTSKVLRAITPTSLASLMLLESGQATTQTAIADAIGRDQSTISSCFQSLRLDDSSVSLVEKVGSSYTLTPFGERVLDYVSNPQHLGIELETVELESETGKERIASHLAPLYGSRSVIPFLLLTSLAARHDIRRTRKTSQAVPLAKVLLDVDNRLQKINRTTSQRKLRQITERFVEREAITADDDHLRLTEKGQRQAELLNRVAKVVSSQTGTDQTGRSDSPTVDDIAVQMRRRRLATSYSLENNDPELVDESHIYRRLRRIDVLDSPNDDWHSHRWVTIENVGATPTTALVHKESGETKITFEDLEAAAFMRERSGQKLQVEDLNDFQPAMEQKMAIYFPDPLPPGESLTIYYTLSWPNELAHYPHGELDQSISLTRYPLGVDELQFGIVDRVPHVGVDCEKFVAEDDQYWECLSILPEQFDGEHVPNRPPRVGDEFSGYLYTIESPEAPGYRIAYTLVE